MSVLQASNVGMSFGAVDLFGGVSVQVPDDGRIGLVGPNGSGKTTLLLALVGRLSPSSGSVHVAKGTRIGYLPQEAVRAFTDEQRTVHEEMLQGFADLRADEVRLRRMEQVMAAGEGDDELVERYGEMQQRFELRGGYDIPQRIARVLSGLDLDGDTAEQPLAQLSGGQKTRTLLARLLLEAPDLLVLDEPTNHLDVAAVEWLETTLANYVGAVLVVSHDRYFLDRVASTIWEMGRWGIETYRGNYSDYVRQREERWQLREKRFAEVKARLDKELEYVRRNIAGQRTNQAKGKLSRLAREVEAIHAGGLQVVERIQSAGWLQATSDLTLDRPSAKVNEVGRRIDELPEPRRVTERIRLRMASAPRGGDVVLRAEGLEVGFPDIPLFYAGDLELRRGHVAALLGPNGAGKTTFLRTLLGQHPPRSGTLRLGDSLRPAYFSQAHEGLEPDNEVLDELLRHHAMQPGEARSYLAGFLFSGDDVFKRVSALSGGERGRLALAVLARKSANVLVLDEPTNHLDIPAQEVLEGLLQDFEGTVIMVTHDRYLVDRLATRMWVIEGDRLTTFEGSYSEWLARRERDRAADAVRRGDVNGQREALASTAETSDEGPTLSKNERRRLEDQLAALEERIASLEGDLEELSEEMQAASQEGDFEEIQRVGSAHDQTQEKLERLYAEWEALGSRLG